ncbi:MAG TPA: hypothetical protein VGK46_10225, partial [Saprospiraceae bacterium]
VSRPPVTRQLWEGTALPAATVRESSMLFSYMKLVSGGLSCNSDGELPYPAGFAVSMGKPVTRWMFTLPPSVAYQHI